MTVELGSMLLLLLAIVSAVIKHSSTVASNNTEVKLCITGLQKSFEEHKSQNETAHKDLYEKHGQHQKSIAVLENLAGIRPEGKDCSS